MRGFYHLLHEQCPTSLEHTDDQAELLCLSSQSLVLDGEQPTIQQLFRVVIGLRVDDDLRA